MSFVERNRRWLLPALALPLAGVAWMNLPGTARPATGGASPAPLAAQAPPAPASAYAEDNEVLPLLLAGRQSLSPPDLVAPRAPRTHPVRWTGLNEARGPAPAPRPQAAAPVPRLDFLLETPTRLEAWMGGRACREGDALEGGFVLKKITGTGVLVTGPHGEVRIPLMKQGSPP
ncbi:hypothetical protein [Mesoterricola silvestris]|uniref:Uncharacterized protein n=1 Tax=Mesoterricola silvestris TaxID=2927979 RepID=A0AA48GJ17_9BACT|nr:hypothetical protein [Mesoterricola silvestris]BDU72207.1 hypothetical protein METEAL_13810 [Mesoterricola silvestris]